MKKKIIIFSLCVSVITLLSLLSYTYITTNLKPFDVWLAGGPGSDGYYANMPLHFEVTLDKQLNITYDYLELGAEKKASKKLTLKERKELKKLVDDVKKNANPKYSVGADGFIIVYVDIDGIEYQTSYKMHMGGETVYNKQVEKLAHKLIEISPVDVFVQMGRVNGDASRQKEMAIFPSKRKGLEKDFKRCVLKETIM